MNVKFYLNRIQRVNNMIPEVLGTLVVGSNVDGLEEVGAFVIYYIYIYDIMESKDSTIYYWSWIGCGWYCSW